MGFVLLAWIVIYYLAPALVRLILFDIPMAIFCGLVRIFFGRTAFCYALYKWWTAGDN